MDENKKNTPPKLSKSLPPFTPGKPLLTKAQVRAHLERTGTPEDIAFSEMSPEERDLYMSKKNSELNNGPIRDYKNGPDDAGIGGIWGLNGDD